MNENFEKALTAFLQFRKVKGLASRTLKDYRYHIEIFASKIPANSDDYRAATFAYLGEEGISNNTHNIRRAYLKCFFSWCIEEGFFDCPHPLKGLNKRRPTSRIINIPNDTISALLALPDKSMFGGLRDYSLLCFALDTGARPSEALSLRPGHFNFSDNTVTISASFSKTRTERTIPISASTSDTVRKLLSVHHEKWNNAAVFCSADGNAMRETSWCHILKSYSKRLNVNITPYHLRHVAALSLLRGGASAFHVQRIMGHSSITMTEKYIALQIDDLKAAHSKASLINSILPPAPPKTEIFRQRKIA